MSAEDIPAAANGRFFRGSDAERLFVRCCCRGKPFHEDTQTYYGKGWAGQTALWQMVYHHGARLPYMQVDPSQWSTYEGSWAATSETYRKCCTIKSWPGQALATLLMSAKSLWNHDAYFDNVEDWMRKTDLYAANRGAYPRPSEEGSTSMDLSTRCGRRIGRRFRASQVEQVS